MPRLPSVLRVGIFAVAALSLYIALAVGVGFGVGTWVDRDDNLARIRDQARRAHLASIPVGWQAKPELRGHITALESWSGALFASGPGIGVMRADTDELWEEFNAGMEPGIGVVDLAGGPAGFFALDDKGSILHFEDGRWNRVSAAPPGVPRRLGLRGKTLDVATADASYVMDLESGQGRRSPTPWHPAGSAKSADRAVALWWLPMGAARVVVSRPDARGAFDPPADVPRETGLEVQIDGAESDGERRPHAPTVDVHLDENSTPFVRVLVAFEEIGVVDARVSDAGIEQWTELRKGLPMVSATAVTLWNGQIYVGTQSKGVFRYVPELARFEPFNQGLLLTTAEPAQDQ